MESLAGGQLIELVQQFSNLYDKSNPKFKNKLAVENAWQTIADILEVPAEACESRWDNIRHRFAKERRTIKNKPSGSAGYCTWQYYEQCLFLDNVVVPRKTTGNIRRRNTESVALQEELLPVVVVKDGDAQPPKVDGVLEESSFVGTSASDPNPGTQKRHRETDSQDATESAGSSRPPSASGYYNKKKRSSTTDTQQLSLAINNSCKQLEKFLSSTESEDEDLAFGKVVGLELRKITSTKLKLTVISQILSMLSDYTDS